MDEMGLDGGVTDPRTDRATSLFVVHLQVTRRRPSYAARISSATAADKFWLSATAGW